MGKRKVGDIGSKYHEVMYQYHEKKMVAEAQRVIGKDSVLSKRIERQTLIQELIKFHRHQDCP